jgi:N utilization substance protein B
VTEIDDDAAGGRHAGREVALQVLYALDLAETGPRDARAAREAWAARSPAGPNSRMPASPSRPPSPPTSGARSAALSSAVARSSSASTVRVPSRRTPPAGPAAQTAPEIVRDDRQDVDTDEADQTVPIDPIAASGTAFDRITEHFSVPGSAIAFARQLVAGVAARAAELDEIVGQHARNWRVSRMAAVDRNVLRLAVYELTDTETPVAVVIDEAVDLARRFGSDTSPSFVNGILDAIAREVRVA